MDQQCIAICSIGERCASKRRLIGDGMRCGRHNTSRIHNGPNTMALMELKYVFNKNIREAIRQYREIYTAAQNDEDRVEAHIAHRANTQDIYHAYRTECEAVKRIQQAEITRTGIDPDAHANERRRQVAENRRRLANDRRARHLLRQEERVIRERQLMVDEIGPENWLPQPPRDLAGFAADPQNVHTTEAVRQTKEIVESVRRIPVPEGYRWNTSFVSKTIGEIISDCQLSSRAAAQMFNQYVSSVAIYDIEEGIYGKVLDSVWQYVKTSPDKDDLCKILKQEMTDNVGMCAQGNLSRICNILAGYMEGVGSQESVSERLGRLLPPLIEMTDVYSRLRSAFRILEENGVPVSDWDVWIDPLVDEDDMVIDFEYIRQGMVL